MKKIAICMLAAVCSVAMAEVAFKNIPQDLEKPLLGNRLTQAEMTAEHVLRLQMNKATISQLDYNNFVLHTLCSEQWRNPERFAAWKIAKLELLNDKGEQGFAFDASGDICEQLGHFGKPGSAYRQAITERTTTCTQGLCK